MDERSFALGYMFGLLVARLSQPSIRALTSNLESELLNLYHLDRTFHSFLALWGPDDIRVFEQMASQGVGEIGRAERAKENRATFRWIRTTLLDLAVDGESAYSRAREAAAELHSLMGRSGLHDAITVLADSPPSGYGEEQRELPHDIRWLAASIGMSHEEITVLLGGYIPPQEAISELRRHGGSRRILAELIAMPNPYTRVLHALRKRVRLSELKALWPRLDGLVRAFGGVALAGSDLVIAGQVLFFFSVTDAAVTIQSVYSVMDGLARVRRGVQILREQEMSANRTGMSKEGEQDRPVRQ